MPVDGKLEVQDSTGATQYLDNEVVTTGAGSGLLRQRSVAPESDAILAEIEAALAGTLSVAGTVAVSNFPGSVAVSNFPSSQPVTGTFFQATQPVSAAILPLPAGAATQTTLAAVLAALASVPVTGTFWQTTQPISGAVTANAGTNLNTSALALESGGNLAGVNTNAGAITDAAVAAGATGSLSAKLRAISRDLIANIVLAPGTNLIGKFGIDQTTPGTTNAVAATQAGSWSVSTTPVSDVTTSGNITTINGTQNTGAATIANQSVGLTALNGECTLSIQVEGTWTGTLVVQGRLDGTNWVTLDVVLIVATNVIGTTIASAATGLFQADIAGYQDVRVSASAAATGTATVTLRASTAQSPLLASGGGGSTPTGPAGSPNANVVSVQGISGGTGLPVTGTFWQTTQPISAASLPLPSGAATAANQVTPGSAGTPSANVASVQGVSGMTPVTIATADATTNGSITTQNLNPNSGTATASSTVALTGLNGEGTLTVEIEGTYTGALSVQFRDDGTNWVTQTSNNTFIAVGGTGSATIASAATGLFQVAIAGFQDVRITALGAMTGTATVTIRASGAVGQTVGVDIVTVTGAALTGNVAGTLPVTSQTLDTTASGTITTQNLNPATGTATASSTVALTGLSGTSILTIQVEGTYTGALTLQAQNDSTNWVSITGAAIISSADLATATIASAAVGIWQADVSGYTNVRISANAAVTGTATVSLRVSAGNTPLVNQNIVAIGGTPMVTSGFVAGTIPISLAGVGGTAQVNGGVAGLLGVGGNVAVGSAATSNPVQAGGRVLITLPTTLGTNGYVAAESFTSASQLITKDYGSAENDWNATSGTTALATTGSTTLKAAGAASIRNYCTALQIVNTSTTVSTLVTILDGSTVIWTGYLPAVASGSQPVFLNVVFPTPLKGSTATAMNIQLATTAASVYYNAQGYQSF